MLEERSVFEQGRDPNILREPRMFQVARSRCAKLREVIAGSYQPADDQLGASIILCGQIKVGKPTISMIYPEGNSIKVSQETPFFQIGETTYGKPILVRSKHRQMDFADAIKLLLVSFDPTVKSNLSVGLPFDLQVYQNDSFDMGHKKRINEGDEVHQTIGAGWGNALRDAFQLLPRYKL